MAILKTRITEGQTVHYVQQLEGQVGTTQYGAIVSRVHANYCPEIDEAIDIRKHAEGVIDLFAFMENAPVVVRNVPYSAEELPNTWHELF